MAHNQTPAFFVVALLLLAAATPLALAQAPPPLPDVVPYLPMVGSLLTKITVYGKLCCGTFTLSCPGGAPLVGFMVKLDCSANGVPFNVGQGVTDVNGNFFLTVANLSIQQLGPVAAIVGGPLPCTVKVQLNKYTSTNIGVPLITSLFLGSNGLEGLATVKNSQADAPV